MRAGGRVQDARLNNPFHISHEQKSWVSHSKVHGFPARIQPKQPAIPISQHPSLHHTTPAAPHLLGVPPCCV